MPCVICKTGKTEPGETTVTLERGDSIIIIKKTPAAICATCGEYYLDESVSKLLLDRAEDAARSGAEVTIQRFAA